MDDRRTEFCFDARPHPDLLSREKEQQSQVFCLRMSVRQIQSREFSRGRRMILLLLGEKAGMREGWLKLADIFAQILNYCL
jgi:tRNA G18 (ribose-2'-O)-methylase SpoU